MPDREAVSLSRTRQIRMRISPGTCLHSYEKSSPRSVPEAWAWPGVDDVWPRMERER